MNMPRHRSFRDLPEPLEEDQIVAVFSFPGMADLGRPAAPGVEPVLSPVPVKPRRGRSSPYPPLLSYAVAVTARVYGSQREALKHLAAPGVWERLCAAYLDVTDAQISLPTTPPTARQQDRFCKTFAADSDWQERLAQRFCDVSVNQAKYLGQFPAGVIPGFANPDPRNLVIGDGTFYEAFSDVHLVTDAATDAVIAVGSRATVGKPRVQVGLTDAAADDKDVRGINHVTLSTWTPYGWVVLANTQALGGEVHAARRLIAVVHRRLGERLHTVVWDKALSGWHIGSLLVEDRLLVVNKSVARAKNARPPVKVPRLTAEEAIARYERGQPLPLGISVYPKAWDDDDEDAAKKKPTKRKETTSTTAKQPVKHEKVNSRFHRYGQPLALDCAHDLWVDDGALWDVQVNEDGWHIKSERAVAVTAVPQATARGYTLPITWRLPCAEAIGGAHIFTTDMTPTAQQRRRSRKYRAQDAIDLLRPVPRIDLGTFSAVHGLRNITESYHSWIKGRLGTHTKGRAMRLTAGGQFLDHLCAGTLANALTARRAVQMGHQ